MVTTGEEIKRFFKKNIKPDKCGDNYRGRWITCGHPDPHGVSHCCVKSWVLQEKGTYYRMPGCAIYFFLHW